MDNLFIEREYATLRRNVRESTLSAPERMVESARLARAEHDAIMSAPVRAMLADTVNAISARLSIAQGDIQTCYRWMLARVPRDHREDAITGLSLALLESKPRDGRAAMNRTMRYYSAYRMDTLAWTQIESLDADGRFGEDGEWLSPVAVQVARNAYWDWHHAVWEHGDTRKRPQGRNGHLAVATSETEMERMKAVLSDGAARKAANGTTARGGRPRKGAHVTPLTPAERQQLRRMRQKARALLAAQSAS